jgi:hypothetical protein
MRTATAIAVAALATGCDAPSTTVVLENDFPASDESPLVIYDALWQAVELATPLPPGHASDPQSTVPASANTAYVLLAPGWDPGSGAAPAAYVLLQSRDGFQVQLGDTLHIPVDDATFAGNCAAGSRLTQEQALFMIQRVFAADFGSLGYDAATCTTTGER